MTLMKQRASEQDVPDAGEVRERIAAVTREVGAEELQRASLVRLLRRVVDDAQTLLDKQIELVRQEVREEVRQVVQAGRSLGIGAVFLVIAAICLVNTLFLGIDTLFPRWGWLAALIATVICGAVGAVLVNRGRKAVRLQPLARTRATLKEDADWARQQLRRNGKSP